MNDIKLTAGNLVTFIRSADLTFWLADIRKLVSKGITVTIELHNGE